MVICNFNQVKDFKDTHKNCQLETKLTNDDKDTVVIRCAFHSQLIVTQIPYRLFCLDKFKCAGLHSCPRNYSCCE